MNYTLFEIGLTCDLLGLPCTHLHVVDHDDDDDHVGITVVIAIVVLINS